METLSSFHSGSAKMNSPIRLFRSRKPVSFCMCCHEGDFKRFNITGKQIIRFLLMSKYVPRIMVYHPLLVGDRQSFTFAYSKGTTGTKGQFGSAKKGYNDVIPAQERPALFRGNAAIAPLHRSRRNRIPNVYMTLKFRLPLFPVCIWHRFASSQL